MNKDLVESVETNNKILKDINKKNEEAIKKLKNKEWKSVVDYMDEEEEKRRIANYNLLAGLTIGWGAAWLIGTVVELYYDRNKL